MKINVSLKKHKKLSEYEEALDRLNWHSEAASDLAATLMNTANEVFRGAEDKELFDRLTFNISQAESAANATRDILGDILGLFDVELKEKIKELDE